METSCRSWCRLCAQQSGTISIFANSYDLNMPDLIKDILHFEIHPTDKAPVTICRTCVQFISSVFKFIQHASKVQSMYSSMICDHMNTNGPNIKSQLGLVKEEPPEWCINDYDPPVNALNPHIEFSVGGDENHVEKKEEIEEIYVSQTDPLHVSVNCETRHDYDLNASTSSAGKKIPEEVSVDDKTDSLSNDTDDDGKEPLASPVPTTEQLSTKPTGKRKYKTKQAPPFPCDSCDKIFAVRKALNRHRSNMHVPKNKCFTCKICNRAYDKIYRLKQHETVHRSLDEKQQHPCPLCDKKFIDKNYVQSHIRTIHGGERPFVCEKCGQSFTSKGNLKGHTVIHSEVKAYKCSTCGKDFKCASTLKRHEDIHSETKYPCPICAMELNSRVTLKRHMLVHSDVKRFECKFCSSKFKQSKTLKTHLLTHSGLQPYACQFCDRTFVNGANCRSHKRKVHPVELALMEASGEKVQPIKLPKLEHLLEAKIPGQ